ncbi:MAG: hypothetical protein ABH869_07155 [Candidatus Omnitrophota bacterium]
MVKKTYNHKVTLSDRRRTNKRKTDLKRKGISTQSLSYMFNLYYKDPARALYKEINGKGR